MDFNVSDFVVGFISFIVCLLVDCYKDIRKLNKSRHERLAYHQEKLKQMESKRNE